MQASEFNINNACQRTSRENSYNIKMKGIFSLY